ncbi:MAG: hypothetical protein ED559_12610 [Phycisphaera sp.]|nr:MAG: hypothetical protein ED559_12610 [Phycisphaera sp.]
MLMLHKEYHDMKQILRISIAAAMAMTLTACGGGEGGTSDSGTSSSAPKVTAADFTGSWQVDKESMRDIMLAAIEAEAPPEATEEQKQMMRNMAEPMIEGMSINLSINEDKTFSVDMQMMGESESTTGTWTLDNGVITMTENTEEGENSDPATGKLEDGKLMLDFPGEEGGPDQLIMIRG